MRIPADSIISPQKVTHYLLVHRRRNDKSKFLARAGFSALNPAVLEQEIRRATADNDALVDRTNEHGVYYRIDAELIGVNGVALPVAIIWLQRESDGSFHFVTLKPRK